MLGLRKIFSSRFLSNTFKNYGPTFTRNKSKVSKFDKQFVIVRVTQADYQSVLDLFRYTYFNNEPTMVAIGLAYKYNPILENRVLESLSQGMSLMVKCRANGTLVGVAVNTALCPWDPDQDDDYANTCTCMKLAELLRFYSHVSRTANLWDKYNEKKLFEVTYLATDSVNQQSGIGTNLLKKSLELGKDLRYHVLKVDATSYYSQKICNKLKMTMVHEIPYKSYVGSNGNPILIPPPPHNSVQIFVSLPHACPEVVEKLYGKK